MALVRSVHGTTGLGDDGEQAVDADSRKRLQPRQHVRGKITILGHLDVHVIPCSRSTCRRQLSPTCCSRQPVHTPQKRTEPRLIQSARPVQNRRSVLEGGPSTYVPIWRAANSRLRARYAPKGDSRAVRGAPGDASRPVAVQSGSGCRRAHAARLDDHAARVIRRRAGFNTELSGPSTD